jgi:translation initiation factor 6 (eIF-6)
LLKFVSRLHGCLSDEVTREEYQQRESVGRLAFLTKSGCLAGRPRQRDEEKIFRRTSRLYVLGGNDAFGSQVQKA